MMGHAPPFAWRTGGAKGLAAHDQLHQLSRYQLGVVLQPVERQEPIPLEIGIGHLPAEQIDRVARPDRGDADALADDRVRFGLGQRAEAVEQRFERTDSAAAGVTIWK